LGYESQQQSAISAAVFAIAYKAVSDLSPAKLKFFLSDDRLMVRCQSSDVKPDESRRASSKSQGNQSSEARSPTKWRATVLGDLAMEPGLMVLSFPLPAAAPRLDLADIPWVIREMSRITPLDTLEEFYYLNRELLRLLRMTKVDRKPEARGGHAA
jgi:hypothetical protein